MSSMTAFYDFQISIIDTSYLPRQPYTNTMCCNGHGNLHHWTLLTCLSAGKAQCWDASLTLSDPGFRQNMFLNNLNSNISTHGISLL